MFLVVGLAGFGVGAWLWVNRDVPPATSLAPRPAEGAVSDAPGIRSTITADTKRKLALLVEAGRNDDIRSVVTIDYPANTTIFPPKFPAPTFLWHDGSARADGWIIKVPLGDAGQRVLVTAADLPMPLPKTPLAERPKVAREYKPDAALVSARRWKPDARLWAAIQKASASKPLTLHVAGFRRDDPTNIVSRGQVTFTTSADPVDAPIFYRDVPLPFIHAFKNARKIRYRLGDVTSDQPAPTLLTNMKVCGNCHSFTPDGKTLAMDVDYGNDKGSYVIADIEPVTVLSADKVISWCDYKREDGDLTFGLLSQISPDGRHVISTVKDRAVFSPVDDLYYSQRFFPIKGILVNYDRQKKTFSALEGANDPKWVQSNPEWSPDGKTVLFARAKAHDLPALKDKSSVLIKRDEAEEFFGGGRKLRFDIYRIPFNQGQGGQAKPLAGASDNGKSNYFPQYSPDGKWIVFCQADSFMLLRPDSALYIMPAEGGTPRKMTCNFEGKMNSWHSFSPNGRWLVFASKARGPYTQLWLTHIDASGKDSPAVLLEHFVDPDRAANIPEFVNVKPEQFASMRQEFADHFTHYRLATLHTRDHEFDEAIQELAKAIEHKADFTDALYLMASCLARTGKEADAIPYAQRALRGDENHWRTRRLLGGIYSRDGHYKQARAMLEQVLATKPDDPLTLNNLAWMLATCPDASQRDGAKAVEYGKKACKITESRIPPMLDSLAAAYAEAGQFALAVETVDKALHLVRQRPGASTKQLDRRRKLYLQRRAYREGPAPR